MKFPKSTPDLMALRQKIEADPKNQLHRGFWKYTVAARRKLSRIDWAITANLRAGKLERGEAVNDEGYSGRQSNRRR